MYPVIEDLKQKTPNDPEFLFPCPGCNMDHWFKTTGDKPRWTWNGDRVAPTVSPSIRVRIDASRICHFFIRNGRIEFLNDCWHELKGMVVNMQEVEQ